MRTGIKKILNFSILFIIIIYAAINCNIAEDEKGTGNVMIFTPKSVPINKLVAGMSVDQAIDLNGSVRYEVVVESSGQRIKSVILKNDDSAEISIPAGIKLDIGVGLYIAVNGTNNDESINTYLVTDMKKNFIAMPNQTVYLDFTLDFNKPAIIDFYYSNSTYPNAPGMADITSAVIYSHQPAFDVNEPIFTVKSLLSEYNPRIITYNNSNYFNSIIGSENEGKVFKVDDPDGYNNKAYWYIDTTAPNVLFDLITVNSTIGLNGISFNPIAARINYKNNSQRFLKDAYMLESIRYDTADDNYYYFFIYKTGMLTLRCIDYASGLPSWTQVTNIDFSPLAAIHPELPFVLDIENDLDKLGNDVFFASKIGLFYIDHIALDYFSEDQYDRAINRLKRLIRIPDPYDDRKSIIISSVKVLGNNIYLGTRYGLYKINKSSKAWTSFNNKAPDGDFSVFDVDSIEKIKSFKNNPITSLESNGSDILTVAAAKSVYFKNVTNGDERELTVWDGLPFIPSRNLDYEPEYNNIDYYEHGQSPVRFILWDSRNLRFWIAAKHGLASIDLAELF